MTEEEAGNDGVGTSLAGTRSMHEREQQDMTGRQVNEEDHRRP